MKKFVLLFVAAFLAFSSSSVMAEGFVDGREILGPCLQARDKMTTASHDAGRCFGFLSGVADLYDIMTSEGLVKPSYCPPVNVSLIRMINVVVNYLQQHPEDLHYSASSLVMAAYADAFPCARPHPVK